MRFTATLAVLPPSTEAEETSRPIFKMTRQKLSRARPLSLHLPAKQTLMLLGHIGHSGQKRRGEMKKFAIREVETLKTTASGYGCWCYVEDIGWIYVCAT